MQLLTEEQIKGRKDEVLSRIEEGAVFLYPTDTVYSLGCDATDSAAVKRLRGIKESQKSFSVIAPSKKWIYENCEVSPAARKWVEKLPGPYTLHLPLKKNHGIAKEVHNDEGKIAVRMVDHHFQEIVEGFGKPIITTSANRVGKEIMNDIERLDAKIKPKLDMVLYEGAKVGKISEIVDLTK